MNLISIKTAALLAIVCALPWVQDSEAKPGDVSLFKSPVRLEAGDNFLGQKRLYPSPVLHDMDGDGLPDIVVGDLWGKVTVATGLAGSDGKVSFAQEKAAQNRDGKPLKFNNW